MLTLHNLMQSKQKKSAIEISTEEKFYVISQTATG